MQLKVVWLLSNVHQLSLNSHVWLGAGFYQPRVTLNDFVYKVTFPIMTLCE